MCFFEPLFKETRHRKEDPVNMPGLQKGRDLGNKL